MGARGAYAHHQERDMWQRYSTNILIPNEYTEECWMGVHSDAFLQWLFGPEFMTTQLSINALTSPRGKANCHTTAIHPSDYQQYK
jgi:hypothetical protein